MKYYANCFLMNKIILKFLDKRGIIILKIDHNFVIFIQGMKHFFYGNSELLTAFNATQISLKIHNPF